MTMQRFISILV